MTAPNLLVVTQAIYRILVFAGGKFHTHKHLHSHFDSIHSLMVVQALLVKRTFCYLKTSILSH